MRKFEFEGQKNVSGDRIRELRLRARLSQAALAAKMQTEGVIVEQDVISRIESGSRLVTDYELLVLTRIFSTTADWLIGAESRMPQGMTLRRFASCFSLVLWFILITKGSETAWKKERRGSTFNGKNG